MRGTCSPSRWESYKWIVLLGACLNQTFCGGYLNSTMAFMSIFYADRFGDRKIAGVIGTVQSGVFFLTGSYMVNNSIISASNLILSVIIIANS